MIKVKFGIRPEPEKLCLDDNYMNIVKSDPAINYNFIQHTVVENVVNNQSTAVNANGLSQKYTCFEYDNHDFAWYPINAGPGRINGQEFSIDNQEILKKHLDEQINKKDKIVIVEIGVNRNGYVVSSTSVFLDNKRHNDIYIGIDIEDKSVLNDNDKNIFTIHSSSNNIEFVFAYLKNMGIESIDILMIDGYHSINQVYFEWENYTPLLSSDGIVVMHDTNSHPGPYFLMKSIDINQYDVYKYLNDVVDWGIGVAVRKYFS
jgi:cephalosporin hydroxylase